MEVKYSDVPYEKLLPSSPSSAIKDCDAEFYPNTRILLQLACTIPVTSCECERSASALRRLDNYTRSHEIINGERTSGQSCLHCCTFIMNSKSMLKVLFTCLHLFTSEEEWKWNHRWNHSLEEFIFKITLHSNDIACLWVSDFN